MDPYEPEPPAEGQEMQADAFLGALGFIVCL